MAVGQGVLRAVLDVGALDAVESRLEQQEVARSAAHAALLRDVLELHALHTAGGCGLATVAQLALLIRSSEFRAGALLAEAQLLIRLPGALEALDCGLLTVEQARLVCSQLGPLDEPIRLAVWDRLQTALISDDESGIVRTPARLRALLTGWVIQADTDAAARRRRDAQADGSVDYRRRDDGLVDLFATGLTAPNARAVLSRIRAHSTPVGPCDERPAGQRRLDALVDLVLGRDRHTLDGELGTTPQAAAARWARRRRAAPMCRS